MPTNDGKNSNGDYPPPAGDIVDYPKPGVGSKAAGYEMTDVNAGGIIVFLGGLFGFVIIFFFFCFLMGRVINVGLEKQDGATDKWHTHNQIFAGARANGGERENLKSNTDIQQQELQAMTTAFPSPRLDTDDGNQATADLHAREDLLLDYYSSTPGDPAIRIPIERAMELIAAKGLPVTAAGQPAQMLAEDKAPTVLRPLTSGFARTGYELDTIEARQQKMDYGKAEAVTHAELAPIK